jgi:hypothetical protein
MREMREEGFRSNHGGWQPRIMQFSPETSSNCMGEIFQPRGSPNSLLAVLLCSLSRSLVGKIFFLVGFDLDELL